MILYQSLLFIATAMNDTGQTIERSQTNLNDLAMALSKRTRNKILAQVNTQDSVRDDF